MRNGPREHGLLINFGSHKFAIKKYILNDQGPRNTLKKLANLLGFAIGTALLLR